MTRIGVYKDTERVSGLEVKFEAVNATGYPPITHLYGRSHLTSEYKELDISSVNYK